MLICLGSVGSWRVMRSDVGRIHLNRESADSGEYIFGSRGGHLNNSGSSITWVAAFGARGVHSALLIQFVQLWQVFVIWLPGIANSEPLSQRSRDYAVARLCKVYKLTKYN